MRTVFFLLLGVICHSLLPLLPLVAQETENESQSYLMRWTAVTGAQGYRLSIQRQNSQGAWVSFWTGTTANTQAEGNFEPGSYRYRVLALDMFGEESPPSNWHSFNVIPTPEPAAPAEEPAPPDEEPLAPVEEPAPPPAEEPAVPPPAEEAAAPAEETDVPAFMLGMGAFTNFMDTGNGLGIGGSVSAEYRFNPLVSLGTNLYASWGFNGIVSAEADIFVYWYPLRLKTSAGRTWLELSLGPAFGALAAFPNDSLSNSRGSIVASLDAHIRFLLNSIYIEPYFRAGYPFLMSAGLNVGWGDAFLLP
jgi:hypothetical protein